jgi:hypothetical protein
MTVDLRGLTVGELLAIYGGILDELRARGLVRTNNAPIGDLAEYASALVYGGELEQNSKKGYDVRSADGRRVQVKVRNIREDTRPSSVFSPLRSDGYDVCLFILVDSAENRVEAAYEWSRAEVDEHGAFRAHVNGTVVRVRQVRSGAIGLDLSAPLRTAWVEMLALGSAVGVPSE